MVFFSRNIHNNNQHIVHQELDFGTVYILGDIFKIPDIINEIISTFTMLVMNRKVNCVLK